MILAITLVLAVIEDTLMALSLAYCLNSQRVTRSELCIDSVDFLQGFWLQIRTTGDLAIGLYCSNRCIYEVLRFILLSLLDLKFVTQRNCNSGDGCCKQINV